MKLFSFRLLVTVLLSLGLVTMAPATAGETKLSIRYAGTGIDTGVNVVQDDFSISVDDARAKGTFGDSTIAITAEFVPTGDDCADDFQDLPENVYDKFDLFYSAAVITFSDLSQLFGVSNPVYGAPHDGWLCLNSDGTYFGKVDGIYVGGTGRFEGASGTFSSPFQGQFLDPPVGFRSITGSVLGTVSKN